MDERYDVIMADCPWFYNERSANRKSGGRGTKFGGGACSHYSLMKDKDLLVMSDFVKSLAADNAAMFMWATGPRKDFAIELLKAWGFRYATNGFTWIKTTKHGKIHRGPGSYTASNAEFVLLGIKGSKRPEKKLVDSVVRIELFARHTAPGWDAWGDQIGKLDDPNRVLSME
jgi:N6-adenosine-specific RNA methylase IME4